MNHAMYQEIILDHSSNPRCHGVLDEPDAQARDVNPSCGDVVEYYLKIEAGIIRDVKFTGKGCAISQASASMLAESLVGQKLDAIVALNKEDILGMLGIPISMMRLKCALLPLKVVKLAGYSYLGRTMSEDVYG
mgnify:CR=1 FL=1